MRKSMIANIFFAAGLFNIGGVLLFSAFFTNRFLVKYYPSVFSDFGLISVILWGMTYMAAAKFYPSARKLMAVFALEKAVYVITWILFLVKGPSLSAVFSESMMTGLFLALYGPGDFAFGCFFAWVGLKGYRIVS